jgi:hypothetical protein
MALTVFKILPIFNFFYFGSDVPSFMLRFFSLLLELSQIIFYYTIKLIDNINTVTSVDFNPKALDGVVVVGRSRELQ